MSADDTKRLEGMLEKAGVANPSALLDTVKTDFETLFDIPLTIPEIESVKVAGTLTVVTSDATDVTNGDFLAYDLSAQYSIRETGELQILRFRFSKDVDIQDNSAPFEFDAARPILRESVAGTISVQVKGNESVLWSREFKAADPGLDDIEISVPLQRANRVVPSETANVSAVPKKLRGQVLEFSKKCVLKDLTVVLQARTADDQPWRIVGAAQDGQHRRVFHGVSLRSVHGRASDRVADAGRSGRRDCDGGETGQSNDFRRFSVLVSARRGLFAGRRQEGLRLRFAEESSAAP